MRRCKVCGCSALFFGVNASGLCSSCTHLLTLEIAQRQRLIEDGLRLADQTVNPHSKIANLDQILAQLEALTRYEERGINTLPASASSMLQQVRERKDAVVAQAAQADVAETMLRVQQAALPEAKVALYTTLQLRLADYRLRLSDPKILDPLEAGVREGVRRIRLSAPLERARMAETRGQKEKALACYRYALDFLRSSDPERAAFADRIPEIEERIRALEEAPPPKTAL
jgi:hypothetical protein